MSPAVFVIRKRTEDFKFSVLFYVGEIHESPVFVLCDLDFFGLKTVEYLTVKKLGSFSTVLIISVLS